MNVKQHAERNLTLGNLTRNEVGYSHVTKNQKRSSKKHGTIGTEKLYENFKRKRIKEMDRLVKEDLVRRREQQREDEMIAKQMSREGDVNIGIGLRGIYYDTKTHYQCLYCDKVLTKANKARHSQSLCPTTRPPGTNCNASAERDHPPEGIKAHIAEHKRKGTRGKPPPQPSVQTSDNKKKTVVKTPAATTVAKKPKALVPTTTKPTTSGKKPKAQVPTTRKPTTSGGKANTAPETTAVPKPKSNRGRPKLYNIQCTHCELKLSKSEEKEHYLTVHNISTKNKNGGSGQKGIRTKRSLPH
ncbi:unnamed protein product [Mytilus edulis]|uniref:Uncharacterized protein n=1 Tax=Mytilus edulis TaxID=6550 RepID=A0A8S3QAI4_MYTED|nr:unnamed protein product [Mytilus edulis]